jgi:hypothetical protein
MKKVKSTKPHSKDSCAHMNKSTRICHKTKECRLVVRELTNYNINSQTRQVWMPENSKKSSVGWQE